MSRIAVLGDIHGNIQALQATLADIKKNGGADHIIVPGDWAGYGGNPLEVTDLLMKLEKEGRLTSVRGNHDHAVLDPNVAEDFNGTAAKSIEKHRKMYEDHTDESLYDWMKDRPAYASLNGGRPSRSFAVTHGSMNPYEPYYYPDLRFHWDVNEEFGGADQKKLPGRPDHVILSHSHVPGITVINGKGGNKDINTEDENWDPFDEKSGDLKHYGGEQAQDGVIVNHGQRMLLNPGSVGQPRDGDTRASYGVIHVGKTGLHAAIRRVPYDIKGAQDAIFRAGMPMQNAIRLGA